MVWSKEKTTEYMTKYYEDNQDKLKERQSKRYEQLKQHAENTIVSGKINDHGKWDMWCNEIKRCASKTKKKYAKDFTNEIIFDMMKEGCFYCGNIATTIDRLNSNIKEHTIDNCVGSCYSCNNSKGTADPITFILKAYYYVYSEYFNDDDNIWFVHKKKPQISQYKKSAETKNVPYELTRDYFNELIVGDCAYCRRMTTTWFGIDRVVPSEGYVLGNVVSCCFDCNVDKHVNSVKETDERNKKIAKRLVSGYFNLEDLAKKAPKTILHKGVPKTSKKVCAYGKVYANKSKATLALNKVGAYVCKCINDGRHSNEIFEITDEFYEEYKDAELYITKQMYVGFEHFYVNGV